VYMICNPGFAEYWTDSHLKTVDCKASAECVIRAEVEKKLCV